MLDNTCIIVYIHKQTRRIHSNPGAERLPVCRGNNRQHLDMSRPGYNWGNTSCDCKGVPVEKPVFFRAQKKIVVVEGVVFYSAQACILAENSCADRA